jgi:hypothetical protein
MRNSILGPELRSFLLNVQLMYLCISFSKSYPLSLVIMVAQIAWTLGSCALILLGTRMYAHDCYPVLVDAARSADPFPPN